MNVLFLRFSSKLLLAFLNKRTLLGFFYCFFFSISAIFLGFSVDVLSFGIFSEPILIWTFYLLFFEFVYELSPFLIFL